MEQETFKEAYHPGHEGVGPHHSTGLAYKPAYFAKAAYF